MRTVGWKCAFCEWEHFLRDANINTTRALDHLILKCKAIPEARKASLLEGEAGSGATWKRKREATGQDNAADRPHDQQLEHSSPPASPSPQNSPTPSEAVDAARARQDFAPWRGNTGPRDALHPADAHGAPFLDDRNPGLLRGLASMDAAWERRREAVFRAAAADLPGTKYEWPSSPQASPPSRKSPTTLRDVGLRPPEYAVPHHHQWPVSHKGKAPLDPLDAAYGRPGPMPLDARQPPLVPLGYEGSVHPAMPGFPPWPYDFRMLPSHMRMPGALGLSGYGTPSPSRHPHSQPHHHPRHPPGRDPIDQQHVSLNLAIASFVVGFGLPFSVTEHPLFTDIIKQMRPDLAKGILPSDWFNTQGLQEVYYGTRSKIEQAMSSNLLRQHVSLQSITFKTISGLNVLTFTECQDGRVVYKDTVAIGDSEDEDTYVSLYAGQLATRKNAKWCALVVKDTLYLSGVLSDLEAKFKGIQCYGCAAYQLEQLCEDYVNIFQETLADARFVVTFVLTNRGLLSLYKRVQSRFASKMHLELASTALQIAGMLKRLLSNQSQLRALLGDQKWKEYTRSAQGPNQADASRFASLVGSKQFWQRVDSTGKLLSLVTSCVEFMNSPSARVSHVYLVFDELLQDIKYWDTKHAPRAAPKLALKPCEKRWLGLAQQNGLFHPVHLATLLLDPCMTIHCKTLPQHTMRAMKRLFSQYTASDQELSNLMEAFQLYHARGGVYLDPFQECDARALTKYSELKESFLADEGLSDFICLSHPAILKCKAAGDPVAWWNIHGHDPSLKSVAMRILSAQPVASCASQSSLIGRMLQHVPNEKTLDHERVKMLLYSKINLQLLNRTSLKADDMTEDALMRAVIAAT